MRDGDEPCDVCGADGAMTPFLEVNLVGAYDACVHRCTSCGFRQIRPRITTDELARLYSSDYFDSNAAVGFGDYARQKQRQEREAYFLARRLRRFATRGRVLEVGCALGFLLEALRRFSGWEVAGVDVSPFAAFFARTGYGLDVRGATLEAAAFPDESFDLVILKNLLEHVQRPRQLLLETSRILRPGGWVWLVTPNGNVDLRPFEELSRSLARDAANGSPRRLPLLDQGHLQYFRRQHLLRLFADCGLQCSSFRTVGLVRGLRARGVLPRKRRKLKSRPAGATRANRPDTGAAAASPAQATADQQQFEALCRQVIRR